MKIAFRYLITFMVIFVTSLFTNAASGWAISYNSYSEIENKLKQLQDNYPNIAKLYDIGTSVEGRHIWAIKISDNPTTNENEAETLFVGGHHACEWISVEVPYYLARYLVENYNTNNRVRLLIDSSEIWIVPMLNPDGHEYSRTTNRLWRKNRRDNGDGTFGVDINRNYGYMWGGLGSSGDTSSNVYRGPYTFSEPETQALRDLVSNNEFGILLTYHSYGQLITIPWGYTNDPAPDESLFRMMAQEMSELIRAVYGSDYEVVQNTYIAGDLKDWAYGTLGILPFCIELRPTSLQEGGHVLPEDQILPTFQETLPAAIYLIETSIMSVIDPATAQPVSSSGGGCFITTTAYE